MKYTLTSETKVNLFGVTLFRIKHSTTEQLGGWVQSEANLSQDGNAWVADDAEVSGDAKVFGNAWVSGDAKVFGNARVSGDAKVFGNARVSGDAKVFGNAWVSGDAEVFGNAWVSGDAEVSGDAKVFGNARVSGDAEVSGDAISKPSDCITVSNLEYNITATPKFIRIGCQHRSHSEWLDTSESMAVEMELSKANYPFFMAMIKLLVSHFVGDL